MKTAREDRDHLQRRVPFLQVLLMAALLVIASAYWFVQLVQGAHYRGLAETNRLRKEPLQGARGAIYDRQGRLLVENVPGYNLVLDRSRSNDLESSLEHVAEILGKDPESLREILRQEARIPAFQPVLLAEDLSLSEVARFAATALEHPEFDVEVGPLRLYRYGAQMAHALGHLGQATEAEIGASGGLYKPSDLVGKRGVEEHYDSLLRGSDGERVVEVDHRGRVMEEYGRKAALPGRNLHLSLDLQLQQVASRYFVDRVGAAVALDPDTGEILVLVSSPSYNPNVFSRRLGSSEWRDLLESPNHPLQNRAIQSVYSPGSVFKIVMGIAGLSEGVVDADDTVWCGGSGVFSGRRFRCWKRQGHGRVALAQAIRESCDVYFYHLGQELGIERIGSYTRALHLGRKTGIDIAGEKPGLIPGAEWSRRVRNAPWYPGETISVAIGQGPLLVSPLQMAHLMATVANGGRPVRPHLALDAERVAEPSEPGVSLSPAAMEAVRRALVEVVESGTGSAAAVEGLEVGGKTGTVQVVRQDTWIDNKDLPYDLRDHAWFAAYSTDGDRSLAVAVFVEHGGAGSKAAAPLAKQLFEAYYAESLRSRLGT